MSENDRRDEDEIGGSDPAGRDLPPSDEELLRIWDELEPQAPSAAFTERVAALIEGLRKHTESDDTESYDTESDEPVSYVLWRANADLGATLTDLRLRCNLTVRVLRERLRIDGGVLLDLERNAVYPETLPVAFWRSYAAALQCRTELFAELISSYDRAKIAVSGTPAARSGPGMSPPQRAAFLGEPEADVRAQLDRRRDELVDALRHQL